MADTKISALTAVTALADADVIPVVQGGINKKASASDFAKLANTLPTPTNLTANITLTSAHYGLPLQITGSGITVTFPTAPATTQVLDIFNDHATDSSTVNGVTLEAQRHIQFRSYDSTWERMYPQVAASGGGGLKYRPIAGRYIWPLGGGEDNNPDPIDTGFIYFYPVFFPVSTTIDQISFKIGDTGASGNCKFALYACNLATGKGIGANIWNSGDKSTTTANVMHDNTVALTLEGMYLLSWRSSAACVFRRPSPTQPVADLIQQRMGVMSGTPSGTNIGAMRKTLAYASAWPTLTDSDSDWEADDVRLEQVPYIRCRVA